MTFKGLVFSDVLSDGEVLGHCHCIISPEVLSSVPDSTQFLFDFGKVRKVEVAAPSTDHTIPS